MEAIYASELDASQASDLAALTDANFGATYDAMVMELAARTGVQWSESEIGARVDALMATDWYPMDEEEDGDRVKTTVRLPRSLSDEVQLIADLWNAFDKARKKTRPKKWKPASVMERLISVGVDGFWGQIGGRPETKEGRDQLIREAVERIASKKK